MIKFVRGVILLVGVLVPVISGVMAISRHDQIAPSWIAYVTDQTIYRMDQYGNHRTPLFSGHHIDFNNPLKWTPNGQWIVFVFYDESDSQYHIARIRSNGTHRENLASIKGIFIFTQLSPNGESILFASDNMLFRIQMDGTGLQQLTPRLDELIIDAPLFASWSPDGQWIAFTATNQLYRMRADGADLQAFPIPNSRVSLLPQWSPDGQWILFTASSLDTFNYYLIHPDGTGQQQLATQISPSAYSPIWSPDGEWIVFSSDGAVHKMRADGSIQQEFQLSTLYNRNPVWSPDGEWIMFESAEELYTNKIYQMRSDGTGLRLLSESIYYNFPSWSPPIRSDWHPWRSIAAGIGLIGLAICPWRKLMRTISHDQIHARDSSGVRSAGAAPKRDHSDSAV